MRNLYIEELKMMFYRSADWTNMYAKQKDIGRNHTNYGSATTVAKILRDFGCNTNLPVWEDDGYLKIPFIQVDEWRIDFSDGK